MGGSRTHGKRRLIIGFAAGLVLASVFHRLDFGSSDTAGEAPTTVGDAGAGTEPDLGSAGDAGIDAQAIAATSAAAHSRASQSRIVVNAIATTLSGAVPNDPNAATNAVSVSRPNSRPLTASMQNRIANAQDTEIGRLYGRLAEQSFLVPSCWQFDLSNAHVAALEPIGPDSADRDLVLTSIPDAQADGRTSWAWQTIIPDLYLGERIVVSAQMRTRAVRNHAFMWVSVDDANGNPLAYDSMQDSFRQIGSDGEASLTPMPRTLRGNVEWSWHQIVIDVPAVAYSLSYGFAVIGPGALWADDLSIEVVNETIPETSYGAGGIRRQATTPPIRELTLPAPFNTGFEREGFLNPSMCAELAASELVQNQGL